MEGHGYFPDFAMGLALHRTAQAQAEAQEAAAQAARRQRLASEAAEAAQRMAVAEMDATSREMEDGR